MSRYLLALAALPLLGVAYPSHTSAPAITDLAAVPVHGADEISLLTYNVQDLPWPIAGDRGPALDAIGNRLAALRARGAAPQLVVLQEAFSGDPVAMLRQAGYRHIVLGPPVDSPRSPTKLDAQFLQNRSWWIGEAQTPQLSSGLVIASDYPIGRVAMTPFAADVCAGIDCLANKGLLLAEIIVPGIARPIELMTTHLNSGRKSRTPASHHLYAYRQQLAAIDAFIAREGSADATRLFAGDFNVSHSRDRLAALTTHMARWNARPITAMGKPSYQAECATTRIDCDGELSIGANVPLIHSLDWQFAGPQLRPLARHVLFGRERDGSMLSDHIGYAVRYRVAG